MRILFMRSDVTKEHGRPGIDSENREDDFAGPITISTSDSIAEGFATPEAFEGEWRADQTSEVDTRLPDRPRPLVVPNVRTVASKEPPCPERERNGSERDAKRGGPESAKQTDQSDDQRSQQAANQPQLTMTKMLLIAGTLAVFCGVLGAIGYSYTFGPKSEKSTSNESQAKREANGKGQAESEKDATKTEKPGSEQVSTGPSANSIPGYTRQMTPKRLRCRSRI
jgi:hypothetical protein